jgi:hypothetical protein
MWLLAAVSVFTIGQRMVYVYRQAKPGDDAVRAGVRDRAAKPTSGPTA